MYRFSPSGKTRGHPEGNCSYIITINALKFKDGICDE